MFRRLFSTPIRIGSSAGLALAGLALAGWVLTNAGAGDESLEGEALAILAQAPNEVDIEPGDVLYTRAEYYKRYGPKAELIASVRNITTESNVRETWMETNDDREIVATASRVTDAHGVVVQIDLHAADGEMRSVDPSTGEVLREATDQTEAVSIDLQTGTADIATDWIADGTFEVAEISGSQVTLEREVPVPESNAHWRDEDFFVVPFYLDLDPQRMELRQTFDGDSGIMVKSLALS